MERNKTIHRDILKLFAIFWVTYNHTGESGWLHFMSLKGSMQFLNITIACFTRIGVPLFFMISGANLLGKQESIGIVFKKRILRIVALIFVAGSFLYAFHSFNNGNYKPSFLGFLQSLYVSFENCPAFLWWYLAFLVFLPALRLASDNLKYCKYITIFWWVIFEVTPLLETLQIVQGPFVLRSILDVSSGLTFLAFPLAGYMIENTNFSLREKLVIVLIGVLSFISQVVITRHHYLDSDSLVFSYSIAVVAAIYIIVMEVLKKYPIEQDSVCKVIRLLAGTTLGTFLLQGVLVWDIYDVYCKLEPVVGFQMAAFIWVICCLVLCQIIVLAIKQLPIFRKIL